MHDAGLLGHVRRLRDRNACMAVCDERRHGIGLHEVGLEAAGRVSE